MGRSPDTVSRIAKTIGHRFGRTNLASATTARSAYCAEVRAEHAAQKAQERMGCCSTSSTKEPLYSLDGELIGRGRPDARSARDLASAVESLQRTVLMVDRHDNKGGVDPSALGAFLAGMFGVGEQVAA